MESAQKQSGSFCCPSTDVNCALCVRNGNCSLQTLASEMDIRMVPFDKQIPFQKGSRKFPLIKDYTKCIKCMRCIQVCDKVQTCKHLGCGEYRIQGNRGCEKCPAAGGVRLYPLRTVPDPLSGRSPH